MSELVPTPSIADPDITFCPVCGHRPHRPHDCLQFARDEVRCACVHDGYALDPKPTRDGDAYASLVLWAQRDTEHRHFYIEYYPDHLTILLVGQGPGIVRGRGDSLALAVQAAFVEWQTKYPRV